MNVALTAPDILNYLLIAASVMVIVVLYHLIFIVVDVRKITRRVQEITKEVESMILKPIHVADQVIETVVAFLESQKKPSHEHKNKKKASRKKS